MKNLFSEVFKDSRIGCAAEMHTTAWCNLNCKYCYIPKHDSWKDLHNDIKESIKNGELLKKTKEIFGEKLEYISHWGTEPTLSLKHFEKFYKDAFVEFPNLKEISMSSNFMTNVGIFHSFIKKLPTDKKIRLKIQCSLDGPAWINDVNRQKDSAETISKNLIKFVKQFNDDDSIIHGIELNFKPTVGANFFPELAKLDRMRDFFVFFNDLMGSLNKVNTKHKVHIVSFASPTIVFPYDYTKEDGELFSKMIDNINTIKESNEFKNIRPDNNYYGYMRRLSQYKEFYTKRWMFTCSAGDSSYAVDNKGSLRPCHRVYFMELDNYICATVENKEQRTTSDINAIKSASFNDVKRDWIVENARTNNKKLLKFFEYWRAYHDYSKLTINNNAASILELAHAGLILEDYKDPRLADLFAHFIAIFECPIEKKLQIGSLFLPDMGVIKLFGNGVFKSMCQDFLKQCR